MSVSHVVPVLKVRDMELALAFYQRLGFAVEFRHAAGPHGPHYAGLSLEGHHLHLSSFGGDSVFGAAVYFYVEDVNAFWARIVAAGFTPPGKPDSPVEDGPVDQSWGMREFYVRDPDGNALRFGSPLK